MMIVLLLSFTCSAKLGVYSITVECRWQVDPALKGTQNILRAVAKSKSSVKRVVVTSSIVGMHSFPCLHLLMGI